MKADPKADAAPAGGGSKKLVIILIAVLVLVLGGGGAAAFFLMKGGDAAEAEHEEETTKPKKKKKKQDEGPPVYVPVEPFTVNLNPEEGEQYLQLAFTLQVPDAEQSDVIKNNMPKVRSRILLLLSSKKASEINTPEGKTQLAKEILEQVNEPFQERGDEQEVAEVLFTSFIIQ
ncbi:flagellar basal body-associated protein FliL [Pseudoduganella albidiflava]|uniref:Flagellar protein FliL n=1 Tax=Pseudoduganella albidiflava TaxID=321983 RepID=A0A411WUM2_9BURK|nr:flagellar basal body-associated protein FliL [Pseudoduganella albidiflava]QBI00197.1 flagellar basal body-associated protein FliL [Pseudoduganella albidiflava]GGY70182.1 flagellar biosynthesis protein [Pseudoduganella albidiflava]